MAALVQSYPQQSGTVTMLQTRPASASGMMPASQSQGQQYGGNQQQRNNFYGTLNAVGGSTVYRTNASPIQPYAFTSTPNLHSSGPWPQGGGAYRISSSPSVPTLRNFDGGNGNPGARSRYPASASMTNLPSSMSAGHGPVGSRDDSSLPVGGRRFPSAPRPHSAYMTGATTATATQVTFTQATPIRVSPDRYRRPTPRVTDVSRPASAQPSGSGMATVSHLYNGPTAQDPNLRPNMAQSRTPSANNSRPTSMYSSNASSSNDDIQLHRQQPQTDIQRLRRRSMPALDSADYPKLLTPQDFKQQPEESSRMEHQLAPPKSADREQKPAQGSGSGNGSDNSSVAVAEKDTNNNIDNNNTNLSVRNGSTDSLPSSRGSASRPSSSANRNANVPTGNPALLTSGPDQSSSNQDYPRLVNIPPRISSSDASKTVLNPSPLSKPVAMDSGLDAADVKTAAYQAPPASGSSQSPRKTEQSGSPAVQQLAAISQKTGKPKSKTSRLRRALSFGSAAEFRKAAGPEADVDKSQGPHGPSKLHKEPSSDALYDAEQARIAQQQEEAGIGNSIYAGARIFSGSTDNLSISSTASSASIMIRKMGRGMKKGGRSLVGLFRPKSVIGSPSADAISPEASQAAVSMVTVEAERERVNVNPDPHSQNGGGTGFPRLERNSIDASKTSSLVSDRVGSSGTDNSAAAARKSIVGGERERAEVLAAVRKGILKHRGSSPSPSRGNATVVVPNVPMMSDSPNSSAPSTPNDDIQGHKRSGSVAIGSEDYFMTALRLRQDTKSAPATPQSGLGHGTLKRNATFSPRIIFYDTWPSGEYDRRGEIATCNRLTPMLAQQIKEELNSFKMEMEVHENSKIYTHFF